MTDGPSDDHGSTPSQAEGEDPDRPDTAIVLEAEGVPSKAEGDDPDDTTPVHEVIDPVEPG
jgi:hypothetical protein